MNINKGQLTFVNTVPTFNKMLADPTKNVSILFSLRFSTNFPFHGLDLSIFYSFQIKDVFLPTPEVAAIQWEMSKDFVVQDAFTNVFLAAFTTAWARLKLYSEMNKLGRQVLYHDTDSIIYASDGVNDPPLGNFLGEFTDELDGDTISTFVSGKCAIFFLCNIVYF